MSGQPQGDIAGGIFTATTQIVDVDVRAVPSHQASKPRRHIVHIDEITPTIQIAHAQGQRPAGGGIHPPQQIGDKVTVGVIGADDIEHAGDNSRPRPAFAQAAN